MCALARRDEALRNDEREPAPPFGDLTTVRGRLVSTLCRVLDLQVASILAGSQVASGRSQWHGL